MGAGNGITEEECDHTNKKLRQVLLDFFDEPTLSISEFIYGSEDKTYKAEQINPILQQIIDRFTLALAIIKADCADAYFL